MSNRRLTALRSLSLAVALLLAGSPLCTARDPGSLLHQPAPEFTRNDIQGHRVDLASFRGRVVLLTFWATWCAPCQVELPQFSRWQDVLGARGFQVIAVSMDDGDAPVLDLARRRHLSFPVLMGDEQLGTAYGGILGLPVTFLIDRQGRIAAVFKGESSLSHMKAQILKLLQER